MLRKIANSVLLQVALACLMPLTMSAANLVPNPGFETPATGVTPGTPVSYTDFCEGGTSAAADWLVWVNTCPSDISTTLLPSTAPNGGSYMLHVVTNGAENGIYFCCFANHAATRSSVWVYVNSGCVGMGTGDGATTSPTDEITCVTGQWIEFYKVPNGVSPASEFIIYAAPVSVSSPGADFYVDNAKVVPAS